MQLGLTVYDFHSRTKKFTILCLYLNFWNKISVISNDFITLYLGIIPDNFNCTDKHILEAERAGFRNPA